MDIDVKTIEKMLENLLNWTGEIDERLKSVENWCKENYSDITDLDSKVSSLKDEDVLKDITYYLEKMKMFFSSQYIWNENDDSSKKMLKRFFDVYQR